jgi:hypothetical protein
MANFSQKYSSGRDLSVGFVASMSSFIPLFLPDQVCLLDEQLILLGDFDYFSESLDHHFPSINDQGLARHKITPIGTQKDHSAY